MVKQRCKECNSTLTYLRIKSGERVCRDCGFIEPSKGDPSPVKHQGEDSLGDFR